MQKDVPITDNTLFPNGVLGDNQELLILHKAYLELVDDKEKEEDEDDDKN